MTEPPKRSDTTLDESLLQRTAGVRAHFLKAWQEAVRGGPEPNPETYLSSFNEPERSWLRCELEKTAVEQRRLRAAATEQTHEEISGAVKKASEQSVTVDLAPDTKVDENQQTADFQAAAHHPAGDAAGTLDYAPEPGDSQATLDEPPGTKLSADFSVDDTCHETAANAEYQSVAGYEILGTLGRGAMGVVYRARQRGLRRVVALKMILAGGHASDIELARFRTEAEAVGQLQHPNIVQVYEVGEHNGCPFLSLEFINGDSLQKKLGGMPQPVLHAAQMVQVLAQAMDFAHRKGIIHRDLKPANVMLMAGQGEGSGESSTISNAPLVETLYGVPKIADFGLAKRLEEDAGQTRSGTILGTPSYMAPEQAEGRSKDVGPLADQYALGAILYEMLTGRPPFRGETVLDTLEQVRKQEPVPPAQLQPKVPRDLETICLKALQKEAQKRYADCAALAEDLRRFVASEPILARPVSAPERFLRWCRRNPITASLSAGIAALLVVVTVVSTISAFKLNELKNIAEANERDARLAEAVASDQAKLALDTYGDLVTKVQDKLSESPAGRNLRGDILDMAMQGVTKVAEAGKKKAGLDQRIAASAHNQMGGILLRLGRSKQALEHYQQAHAILTRLAAENPESDKAKGNVAVALGSLGNLMAESGQKESARDYYLKALQLRKEIHDQPGNHDLPRHEVKLSLAQSYDTLARLTADPAEALTWDKQALALYQEASNLAPDNMAIKHALWQAYARDAEISLSAHDYAAAIKTYRVCLGITEDMVKAQSQQRNYKRDLGNVLAKLAGIEFLAGQPRPAEEHYTRSVEVFRGLLQADPRDEEAQKQKNDNSYFLGTAAVAAGDTATAHRVFRELRDYWETRLRTNQDYAETKFQLALCHARCGEHEPAARLAEELRKAAPEDGLNLVKVGCCYALCRAAVLAGKTGTPLSAADRDLQKRYTEQALASLRRAVERGYADSALLETEPDLAPVHSLPEFKVLIKEMKAKGKAAHG
ncbi:MAG TPA: serine/threonine-protein kinase [Gemmataceae bacterium]|nr:serine/threonine-protein kinase [Gemmataceae bacterium]